MSTSPDQRHDHDITARRTTTNTSLSRSRPIDRRTMLRAAGAVGAGALALCPTACSSDDDALTFFFAANPEEARARLRVIDTFQRMHPEIKVRTLLSGPDPLQHMSVYCAGGKCPDVLMAWEFTYSGLAERGVLLDLNPLLAQDKSFADDLRADSVPALYETFSYNGGQYALPEQWSGIFLFFNKKLFAQAGVRTPPGRWEESWSYREFLDAARALTKRESSGRVCQWGYVDTWVPYYSALVFGMNNGVACSDVRMNPTHLNFDNPAFLEGIQFYADLHTKYRVAPSASESQSMSQTDLFASGRAAMALGGHWRYQTLKRAADLDFDIGVLPTGPKGRAAQSNIGTTGLAIAASSPRKRWAWEFVKFAAGPIGQAVIAETGLFVPALRSAVRSAGFRRAHTRISNTGVLTDGPGHAQGLPVTPDWPKVVALMERNMGPVLRGIHPATVLSDELAPQIDQVLQSS